ncbi:hypothetical protein QQP08_021960 [Theobroma cacao]|nr:hypothetical protein QQP08_021960 [Theobroma cacao]
MQRDSNSGNFPIADLYDDQKSSLGFSGSSHYLSKATQGEAAKDRKSKTSVILGIEYGQTGINEMLSLVSAG